MVKENPTVRSISKQEEANERTSHQIVGDHRRPWTLAIPEETLACYRPFAKVLMEWEAGIRIDIATGIEIRSNTEVITSAILRLCWIRKDEGIHCMSPWAKLRGTSSITSVHLYVAELSGRNKISDREGSRPRKLSIIRRNTTVEAATSRPYPLSMSIDRSVDHNPDAVPYPDFSHGSGSQVNFAPALAFAHAGIQ
ncbi:hypothetical protein EVAR_6076_1 [Eumeta japonica]|uniref:Uncharacterized protein n=1 Tax=Eumeta variegata TaxID=151549 RepID=A0A4C1THI6_EUMVA|nr:hypothetical protein EVAR_6076_1 [Eumeta japonica]